MGIVFLNYHLYSGWGDFASSFTDSVCAFLGILLWLKATPKQAFIIGSGVAIGWFWWIGLSFRYYDMSELIPFVVIVIGCVYGALFYLLGMVKNIFLRAILIVFAFDVIAPFGFDWFRPELLLIDTPFGGSKITFFVIVLALATILYKPQRLYVGVSTFMIAMTLFIPTHTATKQPLTIKPTSTHINQSLLWEPSGQYTITQQSLAMIDQAINEKKNIVILPESSFPFLLDHAPDIMDILKEKSKIITIVAGSLSYDDRTHLLYNSAYYFIGGNVQIASKVILVPFGEEIPLPSFARDWLNENIFNGASDYATAPKVTDIMINTTTFRNAICYEATSDKLFEGDPKFMIALSNNDWFLPSFQPILQRKLLTLQAKQHGTTIFHAVNGSPGFIITP